MISFRKSFSVLLFRASLLLLWNVAAVHSWSPSKPTSNSNPQIHPNSQECSRRQLFQQASLLTTLVACAPANAACLQGDLRPVCIGIYKVPMDEAILPYVGTPEDLHKFAPDLTYVPPIEYPKSFEAAMAILQAQRSVADEIKQNVLAGRLEEAGVAVLGLIPQVTAGSRRVFADIQAKIRTKGLSGSTLTVRKDPEDDNETTVEELAIELAENQMNCLTGYWGDCDITIGQGIRGELGKVTVAQLTILDSLRDATCALDDYLVTAKTLGVDRDTA